MMRRRFLGSRTTDMVLFTGWLFADLLLGLMVVFMVSAPGAPPPPTPTPIPTRTPTRTPTPIPTRTPTRTPTPTPTPTLAPTPTAPPLQVLSRIPRPYDFTSDASLSDLPQQIRDRMSDLAGMRAGFVLVFSTDETRSNNVIQVLLSEMPDVFNRGAVMRPYIDLNYRNDPLTQGNIHIEVFVFEEPH